jgi:translation elongation factor EF-G
MILERGFLSFEPLFHDVDVFFRVSVGNQAIRAVMEAYMEDYYFPHLAKALAADVPVGQYTARHERSLTEDAPCAAVSFEVTATKEGKQLSVILVNMLTPNNYRAEVVLDIPRDELAELTSELTGWYERQYPHSFVWYG